MAVALCCALYRFSFVVGTSVIFEEEEEEVVVDGSDDGDVGLLIGGVT